MGKRGSEVKNQFSSQLETTFSFRRDTALSNIGIA